MRIVDKVVQDNNLTDEDCYHDLMTFGCVETYLPVGIETMDRSMDICIQCWCREV